MSTAGKVYKVRDKITGYHFDIIRRWLTICVPSFLSGERQRVLGDLLSATND